MKRTCKTAAAATTACVLCCCLTPFAIAQVPKAPPGKSPPPLPPGAKAQPPGTATPLVPPGKAAPGVPPGKSPAPIPGKGPTVKKDKAPPEKIPAPVDVTLETSDGASIKATWYPGTKKQESIPAIMVHGWEGARGEFAGLARFLQSQGHTSIVPDLRGHGDSKAQRRAAGDSKSVDPSAFRPRDMEAMALDLEACKKFLIEKNNAGECNIEMLFVVGSEFGALLATRYAALDWSVPNLPAYKQGQDVKALVLLTPVQSHRGLTLRDALGHPAVQSALSVMIVAGKQDSKGTADAKRLFNTLQAHHPRVPDDPEEQMRRQEMFLVQPETSLSGTKLLGSGVKSSEGLSIPQEISLKIVKWRLENRKAQFEWSERKNPLGN